LRNEEVDVSSEASVPETASRRKETKTNDLAQSKLDLGGITVWGNVVNSNIVNGNQTISSGISFSG